MSNVVAFAARKPKPVVVEMPTNSTPQSVMDFITGDLYNWALSQGIDLESTDFKYESATIMTVLQGMMFRVTK